MAVQDDDVFACVTDEGEIVVTKTVLFNISCFQKEVYACRDNLTDIVV